MHSKEYQLNSDFIEETLKKVQTRNNFDEKLLRSTLDTLEATTEVFENSHLSYLLETSINTMMMHRNKILGNDLNITFYLEVNPLSDVQKSLLSDYSLFDFENDLTKSKKHILSCLK